MIFRIKHNDDDDEYRRRNYWGLVDELALYQDRSDGTGISLPPPWRAVPDLTSQQWTMVVSGVAAGFASVLMTL